MTKDLFDQLVAVLQHEMGDAFARRSLVESALYGSPVLPKIQWDGAAQPFTRELVRLLDEFGQLSSGQLALAALLTAVREQVGADRQARLDELLSQLHATIATPSAQPPSVWAAFHEARLSEWENKPYALDKRFVNLTLVLDRRDDEPQRAEDLRFDDLHDVIEQTKAQHARVLLGAPGSGKSTLLRRLQYDHSLARLRDGADKISFFVPLNGYQARPNNTLPTPREWLTERWANLNPALPPLEKWLQTGGALLLLDALNEMPHKNSESYFDLVEQWRAFAEVAAALGNELVFTCRRQDYSAALHVPVVEVQPLKHEQVREFLGVYLPAHAERVWADLSASPVLLELYQRPYFLRLLCGQIELTGGKIPRGRAGLFTNFVRKALAEEVKKNSELQRPNALLTEKDHLLLSGALKFQTPVELPERGGVLIPKLSELAFKMQQQGAQVRLKENAAFALLADERAETILKVGVALSVLDDEGADIAFFHQLLQEYFAARQLAHTTDLSFTRVEWEADKVQPSLAEALAALKDSGGYLLPLKQTEWAETALTAAPIAADADTFINELRRHNLPLAASCAAAPEIKVSESLKHEMLEALFVRMRDAKTDLRARIVAGEALGWLGDPRFQRHSGQHGDYLRPPLVEMAAGTYPMGVNQGKYDDETPEHTVELKAFRLGQFQVTNAEYKLFIEADGYDKEQWWETAVAREWLSRQDERQPEYWDDPRFNNPAQPVVGVSWFEACAYCCWLTATATNGEEYRLPTEVEWEAATRGQAGRVYCYGDDYDASRCNTDDGHVGRTTPVGMYDNATPEGAFDLTGNVWEWMSSQYQKYPYDADDGRENLDDDKVSRVLRGGAWFNDQDCARAVYRYFSPPGDRGGDLGFRVVVSRPPS